MANISQACYLSTPMSVALAQWTLDDYHRMIASGILDDRAVELLKGEIVTMAPEEPEHAFLGHRGGQYLESLLGEQAEVRQGRPITLPNQSEPEPDLAIVRPLGSAYRYRHPYPEDVFWVVEFSYTSLGKDLETKPSIYAGAGIPEYWVVNLKQSTVVVFRNPEEGGYQWRQTLESGFLHPLAFADVTIQVARLLGQG